MDKFKNSMMLGLDVCMHQALAEAEIMNRLMVPAYRIVNTPEPPTEKNDSIDIHSD